MSERLALLHQAQATLVSNIKEDSTAKDAERANLSSWFLSSIVGIRSGVSATQFLGASNSISLLPSV